jgi:glycosyltransferase involved in cell wall biosynthesis
LDFAWVEELEQPRGWLRARLGVSDSTIIFGMVGRLTKVKNIPLTLRAFASLLQSRKIDARLVIIGDGEMRQGLESLASSLGIKRQVEFCGWVLGRADIFSDLDVTCLSSFNEGLPVCLVESLAAGVPVVATDVGGVRDVVQPGEDGELVESNQVDAFVEALGRLAQRRARLPSQRSAAVREKFSTARMVETLERTYEELIEGEISYRSRRATLARDDGMP